MYWSKRVAYSSMTCRKMSGSSSEKTWLTVGQQEREEDEPPVRAQVREQELHGALDPAYQRPAPARGRTRLGGAGPSLPSPFAQSLLDLVQVLGEEPLDHGQELPPQPARIDDRRAHLLPVALQEDRELER